MAGSQWPFIIGKERLNWSLHQGFFIRFWEAKGWQNFSFHVPKNLFSPHICSAVVRALMLMSQWMMASSCVRMTLVLLYLHAAWPYDSEKERNLSIACFGPYLCLVFIDYKRLFFPNYRNNMLQCLSVVPCIHRLVINIILFKWPQYYIDLLLNFILK